MTPTTKTTAYKPSEAKHSVRRWSAFCAITALVGVIWTSVFPALANKPALREARTRLRTLGVNPGAMYYTDVEAMNRILAEVDQARNQHPEAFWRVRTGDPSPNPVDRRRLKFPHKPNR